MNANKIVVLTLAMVLVVSMAVAGVSNALVIAKKSSNSDGSGDSGPKSSSSGSDHGSDSGTSGGSGDNGKGENKGGLPEAKPTTSQEQDKQDLGNDGGTNNNPNPNPGFSCADSGGCSVTDKPITPTQNPILPQIEGSGKTPIDFGCHFHPEKCIPDVPGHCPGGFASNDDGNCIPEGPCPKGTAMHDNDESGKCFKGPDFCRFHDCGHGTHTVVKVVHKTKVIHKSDLVHTATVFVPGVGLVEPFNCKLNKDNGKIGCEFVIIKVIN